MLSRTRKGFTLLELIVVIVILGILAAIAIPTFAAVIKKSKFASLRETSQAIGNNAVAIAAFDQAAVRTATGATDAEKAGFAAYTAATSTTNGELPAGIVVSAASTSRFVVFGNGSTAANVSPDTIVACVALPTTVNGATKVSKSDVNIPTTTAVGSASLAAYNTACSTSTDF